MRILNATILLAVLLTGAAAAAEGQGGKADGRTDAGASTTSMGAGGLSGTGAIRDGARTGSVESKGRTGDAKAPPAPADGTSR